MANDLTEYQKRALAIISKHTSSDPIIGKHIAQQIGMKDRDSGKEGADMRSVINALRVKGYPICAIGEGYYYAQTQTELTHYITSFQGRIDKQQEACDGLKKSFENIGRVFNTEEVMRDQPLVQLRKGEPSLWSVRHAHGKRYDVLKQNGILTCACEEFKFSRKRTCKGIELVRAELKRQQKADFDKNQKPLFT